MATSYAFVTLVTSDAYLPGALTLAAALKDVHPSPVLPPEVEFETVCLVTPENVDVSSIKLLRRAFNVVVGVETIVQQDDSGLRLLGRPDLNTVLTKLHVFRLIQYSKIVFLDADVLPIRPLSHLFTLPHEFAAVPDVGWPDIFNSGVLLLTPGEAKFTELNELLKTKGSWDGGDQGLLNEWRGDDWHRLSFTYNTTPTAAYTYAPAYERYGSKISAIHFIGPNKPWNAIAYRAPFASSQPSDPGTEIQRAYDYNSLVDRWFAVYDRHYRVPQDAPEQNFDFFQTQSTWGMPAYDSGMDTHSTFATDWSDDFSNAPAAGSIVAFQSTIPAGGALGLEDLRRMAIEGTGAASFYPTVRGEGEYRSMPLEGRLDLMRPMPIVEDKPGSDVSAYSTPMARSIPLDQHEHWSPPRTSTFPTPGPNEYPPSPHLPPHSLPASTPGSIRQSDRESYFQQVRGHVDHGSQEHQIQDYGAPHDQARPAEGQTEEHWGEQPWDRYPQPIPEDYYLSESQGGEDDGHVHHAPRRTHEHRTNDSQTHLRRHEHPVHEHRERRSPQHDHHPIQHSPQHSPQHHSPQHHSPQHQHHSPQHGSPQHHPVQHHEQPAEHHRMERPRPPSPPMLLWNPAVEPPPKDPPKADAFPSDTYFPNIWDQGPGKQNDQVHHTATSMPDRGGFFQPLPPAEIPDTLWKQGHYRQVTGESEEGAPPPQPDVNKVKQVFPWEEKPRHMPGRVFPASEPPPPGQFIQPSSPPVAPPVEEPVSPPPAQPAVQSPVRSPVYGLPANLAFSNAWDTVPSIQRYASKLVRPSHFSHSQPPPTLEPVRRRRDSTKSWDDRAAEQGSQADDEDEGDDENSKEPIAGKWGDDSDPELSSRSSSSRMRSRSGSISASYIIKGKRKEYRVRGVQTVPKETRSQAVQVSISTDPPRILTPSPTERTERRPSRSSAGMGKRQWTPATSTSTLPPLAVHDVGTGTELPLGSPTVFQTGSPAEIDAPTIVPPGVRSPREFHFPTSPPPGRITPRGAQTPKGKVSAPAQSPTTVLSPAATIKPAAESPQARHAVLSPQAKVAGLRVEPTRAAEVKPASPISRRQSSSSTTSTPSSVGPVSPPDTQQSSLPPASILSPSTSTSTLRKTSRVWDPARGVELFKRSSEEVLARFLKMGSWEDEAARRSPTDV
ncbi:glycogenin glucosyltransferase [Pleurotus ostreatus]|uniref:glycogenin glucosyltransferase n=1 Tax=Pleurotus ostreatus TaxID=5322 RepID=A0A8H6ZY80_PLEOS|nr:glycogenin glucosyltransferase [Pleurotus ostreatus]KAF7436540.1 glycogenin glucosyltransferase [Pleurotus ostreatus]